MTASEAGGVKVTLARPWLVYDQEGVPSLLDPGETIQVTEDEAREMMHYGYGSKADADAPNAKASSTRKTAAKVPAAPAAPASPVETAKEG